MKFSELAKYKDNSELVVSAHHDAWMAKNSNPEYSAAAVRFANSQFLATPRERRGTVSSSSLGGCVRKQQFTYLGMPQLPPKPKLAAIFQTGTFMHIRWQMAGLTAGWLKEAEVSVGENRHRLSGTMDGLAHDGSVVEFKSCNSNSFRRVLSFGPLEGHEYQLGTYLLTTGREKGVFIYEDKDTQEYTEIVKTKDELPLQEISSGAAFIWNQIENKRLVEPLTECEAKTGYKYNNCPYKDRCLKIKDWNHAGELS